MPRDLRLSRRFSKSGNTPAGSMRPSPTRRLLICGTITAIAQGEEPGYDDGGQGDCKYGGASGAVAAGPSVATIWEGMRAYFEDAGVPIVPVLFSSYEEQTEALFARAIDIAWNGPVAYVRCATRSLRLPGPGHARRGRGLHDGHDRAVRQRNRRLADLRGNALPWRRRLRAGARSSRCITLRQAVPSMSTAT